MASNTEGGGTGDDEGKILRPVGTVAGSPSRKNLSVSQLKGEQNMELFSFLQIIREALKIILNATNQSVKRKGFSTFFYFSVNKNSLRNP